MSPLKISNEVEHSAHSDPAIKQAKEFAADELKPRSSSCPSFHSLEELRAKNLKENSENISDFKKRISLIGEKTKENRKRVQLLFDALEESFFAAPEASSSPIELSMEEQFKDISTEKLNISDQPRQQLGVGAIPKTRTTFSRKKSSHKHHSKQMIGANSSDEDQTVEDKRILYLRKNKTCFVEAGNLRNSGNLQASEQSELNNSHGKTTSLTAKQGFTPQEILRALQKANINQSATEQVFQVEPCLIAPIETSGPLLQSLEPSQTSYLSFEERESDPRASAQTQSFDNDAAFNAFRLKKFLIHREAATEAIFQKRETGEEQDIRETKEVFDDIKIKPFVSRKVRQEELRKGHVNAEVNLSALEETKFADARDFNVGIQSVREETLRSRMEAEKGIRFIPSVIVTNGVQSDVIDFGSIKSVVESFTSANDAIQKAIIYSIANLKICESVGVDGPSFSQLMKEAINSLFVLIVFVNEFLEASERVIHILLRKTHSLQEEVGLLEAAVIHLQSDKEALKHVNDVKVSNHLQTISHLREEVQGFLGEIEEEAPLLLRFRKQLNELEEENRRFKEERERLFVNFTGEIVRADQEKAQLEMEKDVAVSQVEKQLSEIKDYAKRITELNEEKASLYEQLSVLSEQLSKSEKQISDFKQIITELNEEKVSLHKSKTSILREKNDALKECARLKAALRKQDLELKEMQRAKLL